MGPKRAAEETGVYIRLVTRGEYMGLARLYRISGFGLRIEGFAS